MTTLNYDKTGGSTRLTRQDTILLDKNFNTGLYHVLREICRKFDRVSCVKRTSLYLKSRDRPAIKHTFRIHITKLRLGLQSTMFAQPSIPTTHVINQPNISNTDNLLKFI